MYFKNKIHSELNSRLWNDKMQIFLFRIFSLKKPTWCSYCKKFIWGITKTQQKCFKCGNCKVTLHRKCMIKWRERNSECVSNDTKDVAEKSISEDWERQVEEKKILWFFFVFMATVKEGSLDFTTSKRESKKRWFTCRQLLWRETHLFFVKSKNMISQLA